MVEFFEFPNHLERSYRSKSQLEMEHTLTADEQVQVIAFDH